MTEFNQNNKKFKSKYWKFVAGFFILIFLAIAGYAVWNKYFGSEARAIRAKQKQIQFTLDAQKKYEEAMKNDTYGGKTPEETLQMFTGALKKGDIDLASKYFVLREDGSVDPKWVEGLGKEKTDGRLQQIIGIIQRSKSDSAQLTDYSAWFTVDDNSGMAEYTIILNLDKQSGIWKIESL